MNYPEWAPQNLIKLHLHRLKNPSVQLDLNQQISQIKKTSKTLSSQQIESIRTKLIRGSFILPAKEGTEILGKLITDQRMRAVWVSLSKRIKNEKEFTHFWTACDGAIQGWRISQKLSTKQRKKYFYKIYEQALALSQMMNDTVEFQYYSITKQIDTDLIKGFLETLDVSFLELKNEDEKIDYTRFWLNDAIPSIHTILGDIAITALRFSKEEPLVRKPNSENAPKHYFIRSLSGYLKKRYKQPLHEVVATTTRVIFDQEDIDIDYVRKLIS